MHELVEQISNYFFYSPLLAVGTASQIPTTASRRKIWGLVGTIRLLAGRYLVVITDAQICGTIAGHTIYRIASTEVIPYTRSSLHLTERQVQNNATYLEMVKSILNTPYFYFSYTYDLSHTMQRLHNTTPEFLQVNMLHNIFYCYFVQCCKQFCSKYVLLYRCRFTIGQILDLYGMRTFCRT